MHPKVIKLPLLNCLIECRLKRVHEGQGTSFGEDGEAMDTSEEADGDNKKAKTEGAKDVASGRSTGNAVTVQDSGKNGHYIG